MNKTHRFLAPSLSLLLVGTMFGCVNSAKQNDGLFTVKTDATITFNAISGIGKWGSTGTSIRTLTLLKGYSWGYLKNNFRDREAVIEGKDIDVISGGDREFAADPWLFSNGNPIADDFIINDDIILNANYIPQYISNVTFVADEEATPADAHHTVKGDQQYTIGDTEIEKGTKWGAVKDNYTPVAVPGTAGEREPFLYYVNEEGDRVSDEYTLKDEDVLKAVYQINHPVDFETDSWDMISSVANLGLEKMSELTHDEGGYKEDYDENGGTFVGLKRDVQIGKKTYHATVIGEDIDKVSTTTNATLTFQIDEIINTNKAYDTIEHNLNRYAESALREYLNENFIYTLSPDLQNAIVPVNKKTNWGGRDKSQGDIRESMEYIFPFSLAELGIASTKTGETEAEGFGASNKDAYVYYQGETAEIKNRRIRKTLNNPTAMTYWVRSPDPDVTGFAWSIGTDGDIHYVDDNPPSSDISLALSVACGFCVGANR